MILPHVVPPVRRGPGRPRKIGHLPSAICHSVPSPLLGAPMPQPRVIAILKCHAPDGVNVANVFLKSDGSVISWGDTSLARSALRQLHAQRAAILPE